MIECVFVSFSAISLFISWWGSYYFFLLQHSAGVPRRFDMFFNLMFFICLPQYTISIIFHTLYTQLSDANQISCFFSHPNRYQVSRLVISSH